MSIEDEVRDIAEEVFTEMDMADRVDHEVAGLLESIIEEDLFSDTRLYKAIGIIKSRALAEVERVVTEKLAGAAAGLYSELVSAAGNKFKPLFSEAITAWMDEGDFEQRMMEVLDGKLSEGPFEAYLRAVIDNYLERALEGELPEYNHFRDLHLKVDAEELEPAETWFERLFNVKAQWVRAHVRNAILDREVELAVKRQEKMKWWQFWRWV